MPSGEAPAPLDDSRGAAEAGFARSLFRLSMSASTSPERRSPCQAENSAIARSRGVWRPHREDQSLTAFLGAGPKPSDRPHDQRDGRPRPADRVSDQEGPRRARSSLLCSSIFARGEQNKVTQKINGASRRERATNDPRCPHHGAPLLPTDTRCQRPTSPALDGETASA